MVSDSALQRHKGLNRSLPVIPMIMESRRPRLLAISSPEAALPSADRTHPPRPDPHGESGRARAHPRWSASPPQIATPALTPMDTPSAGTPAPNDRVPWRLRPGHSFIVALALAALACAQPVPAPPAGESQTPRAGGVLNTIGDEITDFDMGYQGKSSANVNHHGLVYRGLLSFKRGEEAGFVSQVLQPELAERWEVSPDARVFAYRVRDNAKFADIPPVAGRPLTSADIKWTMEYYSRSGEFKDAKLPPSQVREMFEGLESIETPDRSMVRVRFREPFAPFVNYSASQWMPIAAREVYEQDGNLSQRLVGAGPYILDLENSQKGSRWVYKKNPNYWDAPRPYLDGIRRLIIVDSSTQQAAFQTKQVDALDVTALNYATAQEIKKNNPQAMVHEVLNTSYHAIFTSQKRDGPLRDIRVRRAIALAMDRDEYNNVWSGGQGAWALNGSWPGLFTDAEVREMMRTDLAEAKRLLAEAGHPNGLKLEQLSISNPVTVREELAQAQLKRVGIETNLVVLPREQSRAKLYAGDWDLFVMVGAGSLGDGDFDLLQFSHHASSGQNWGQINDPELDRLLVAQRREADAQRRRETQRAVVRRINEMAWNSGYIFPIYTAFTQPYVKNYNLHFTYGPRDAFVWLDR